MTDTRRAMLTVADHAENADDCRLLLAMLGLSAPAPKRRRGRPPVDHGHGDRRTYAKGCRCADCRDANRLHQAELRARWKNDPSSADRAGHGKPSTYKNHGCRCAECTAANTADVIAYKARRRQREALAETAGA
ncbi:hypothetical protein [Streptomyces sp. A012304]|uniref:hypothetical protein n=1 Tax=Streptomyces sp. A012304 TaxID=375446 RepID=UPI0022328FFB|nr:hypothetical protein [Streptomyces sp. A012304]GKQ39513.1 hypothetical protein ALMP_60400 [Streptomyces sp. A012304]